MSLQVTGIGLLTRDAESRKTEKGAWINFGLACRRKNIPEGMQDVDFFEASYFVKNPDSTVLDYLKKGTPIHIAQGELRADKYEKDGQKRTSNKIRIFTFDFLNFKDQNEDKNPPAVEEKKEAPKKEEVKTETIEEELPF